MPDTYTCKICCDCGWLQCCDDCGTYFACECGIAYKHDDGCPKPEASGWCSHCSRTIDGPDCPF